MPRYSFHVASAPETIRDVEGSDLPDLDAARAEALQDARSLMSDAILSGRDISQRQIQICNEQGEVLLRVPFTMAFTGEDEPTSDRFRSL